MRELVVSALKVSISIVGFAWSTGGEAAPVARS